MKRLAVSTRVGLVTLLALALLVPLAGPASAATIGPDAFGYTADTSAVGFFEDISGSGTRILDDVDDVFAQVPIDFPVGFNFYGVGYTEVFVASNGLLTFGSGSTDFTNDDLTLAAGPTQPIIAPLWDDWETQCSDVDAVYYLSAFDSMIVQWHMVSHFNDCPGILGNEVTFQVELFVDGSMEFRYLDVDNNDVTESLGASSTVGIRDASPGAPANGNVLQVSFNTASISSGQTICISLDGTCGAGGGGGGGGGDDGGGHRARTSLTLRGPDAADAGDQITLRGKLRCKKDRCKANAKVLIFRNGQQIGSTRTDSNGRYSFTTNVPGSGEANYTAEFEGKRRCRRSASDVLHVN